VASDIHDELARQFMKDRGFSRRDVLKFAAAGAGLAVASPLLAACGSGGDGAATTGAAAGGGGGARATELAILCWEGYSADNVLDPFRERTGATVTAELLTDDPTGINQLRAGSTSVFDLINVNQPWARQVMFPDNLIVPLDQDEFRPFFDDMLPAFAWPYKWAMSEDESQLLGAVQRFGTFNFVVNTDKISQATAEDEGWNLFNDAGNAGKYGILTWDNWNIAHMCMGAGFDPYAERTEADTAKFEETANLWSKNAKLKTDDMGAMNTALVNGEIDFYCTGGTYTASPARLEGVSNIRAITPNSGPADGKGGIVWVEVTSLVNNPNLSPLAVEFLKYIQEPDPSYRIAMAEGTHNPVSQMGNPEVLAKFTSEDLDALQYDSLEADVARSVDYNVIPNYDELTEIHAKAMRG